MSTPAEKAARLSARLRGVSTPDPEPVGEFLGVGRGVIDSPLRSPVAYDSLLSTRDSEQAGSDGVGNAKKPVGLFEYKGNLDYCLGSIGASNRVCIKQRDSCGYGSHRVKSVELAVGTVYIKCPTRPECVFLTPSVDILDEKMPECVGEFLLQEKRSVEEHVQLFSSLPTEEEVLGEKFAERFKAMGDHNGAGVQFGRTPAKEKLSVTKLWDQEGQTALREGSAGVVGLSNPIQTILSRMQGIEEETFDSSPYKESVSLSVTELAGLVQMQGDAIREIATGTNQMASRIEGGVVGLKADIGNRPANFEDLPGLQLWEIVTGLNRRLEDMTTALGNVESRLAQEKMKTEVALSSVTSLANQAIADASLLEVWPPAIAQKSRILNSRCGLCKGN
jgi:hypothetical protein